MINNSLEVKEVKQNEEENEKFEEKKRKKKTFRDGVCPFRCTLS